MMSRHIFIGKCGNEYTLTLDMTNNHSCEGMNIRDARKRAVFTQVQLSEAAGIDLASISRMENGNSTHE